MRNRNRDGSRLSIAGKGFVAALIAGLFAVWSLPAYADPPPWAPAYGYHAKNKSKGKKKKKHYQEQAAYVAPYGISLGQCNRDVLGGLLGGAVGAAVGSNIGKGDGRTAAIIGGTILGVIVGGSIGQTMNQADQNCVGQALEHAETGQSIKWDDPGSSTQYQVTPTKTWQASSGRYCREYQTTATINGRVQKTYGTACRRPDGSWELMS